MKDKWQKLEHWLTANAPRVLENLNPPASENKIAETEAKLNIKFPPSVRKTYLLHDGQPTEAWGLFGGYRLLSLDDIVDLVEMQVQIEEEYEFGDFDASLMIPLIDLSCTGDFYYVENSVNNEETELIEWWHEEPTRNVKATSFEAFFDDFLSQVENGDFIFHVFPPHRYSDTPPEYGLIDKKDFERMQSEDSSPAEREVISSEVIEQPDGTIIHRVLVKETFRR